MSFLQQRTETDAIAAEQGRFMSKVYLWMSFGLFTTAYTGYFTAHSEMLLSLVLGSKLGFYALIGLQFVLVMGLVGWIRKMSALMAMVMFFAYAMVTGLTLSVIFLVYTKQTILAAFGVTGGMFTCLSAYGFLTKRDLNPIGKFLFMGLIGIILASVVNLFFPSNALQFLTSCAAVLIFSGLTVYDTQKVKNMNVIGNEGTDEDRKEAIYGALVLYLDFINLFLHILRLMGGGRRR